METILNSALIPWLLALCLAIVAAVALAYSQREVVDTGIPALLARMMGRYGLTVRDVDTPGLARRFYAARRICATCQRRLQCREWIREAPPDDIALFCPNEEFLAHIVRK
jgi:hypothetical protein